MTEYAVKGRSLVKCVCPLLAGAAFVLAAALPAQSFAQTVPASIEGKIGSIVDNGDGTGSMTVMGIEIKFDGNVPINSPTASLTFGDVTSDHDLADMTPLPGRSSHAGFYDGTAIVLGNTAGGAITATDIFVEPAENVILGMLTSAENCVLEVQGQLGVPGTGVPLAFLADPRIPAGPAVDVLGFEIDPCTIPVGSGVSVAGYYGEDVPAGQSVPMFYVFSLEADAGNPVNGATAEVTITTLKCNNRLEVRGASSDPNGSVFVFDISNADPILLGSAAIDALKEYRFRTNLGNCPTVVRVTHSDNGATVEAQVN